MKYLKHFKLFESVSSHELKPMNDYFKIIGLSINKLKPFQPSANKIKNGIVAKHRYKIGYNFIKTIFKHLITSIYGREYDIKKLRWIFIDHPSLLGKKRGGTSIYIHVHPNIDFHELTDELIENLMVSDIALSYDNSADITMQKQIQDKIFINILKDCILHYKQNLNLDKEDIYKIISINISNLNNNYSIINSIKRNRLLWKKLAPYFNNGANDASELGTMGFSD